MIKYFKEELVGWDSLCTFYVIERHNTPICEYNRLIKSIFTILFPLCTKTRQININLPTQTNQPALPHSAPACPTAQKGLFWQFLLRFDGHVLYNNNAEKKITSVLQK